MFQRSLSAFLLAAFAAVSLLGHGGLHLLPGGHDCHSHIGSASAQACHSHAGHTHAHTDREHEHCCSHSHAAAGKPSPSEPAPQAPVPHDHDNCLVCQWHAQGQLSSVTVTAPLSEVGCGDVTFSAPQVTTAYRLSSLLTRGPPRA